VQSIKDNSVQSKSGASFHSDGKMLIFDTSEDFAKFIEFDFSNHVDDYISNSKENQPSFRNIKQELISENYIRYSDFIAGSNQEDLINDQFLNEILNSNKIVQIGNYIYRLNKATEEVFVLSAAYKAADYNDLVSENKSNKRILVYSTDEDVIEMVEAGIISAKGLFCNSRSANEIEGSSLSSIINQYSSMYAKARYKKYGISWKLEADVILYNTDASSNLKMYIAMDNCRYKQRCGSVLNNFSHPWLVPQDNPLGTFYRQYRYTLYNSVKKLENYTFKIRGRVEDWKNPVSPNPYNVVFTNWVIISDY
jgi:hypothetical protein